MHQPLAPPLFPEYRRRVLALLLLRPEVLLVGEAGFRDVVEALYPTQAALGREVNPKVFGIEEFADKAHSEPFLRDVLSRPKIFLIGNAHQLEELAGHQP